MSEDWAIEYDLSTEPAVVLLQRSLELVDDTPQDFTSRDVESLEAFWTHLDADFMSAGYIVSLADGRRFNLTYDYGDQAGDELAALPREVLQVRQMGKDEYPSANRPTWEYDVAGMNGFMWQMPLVAEARAVEYRVLH